MDADVPQRLRLRNAGMRGVRTMDEQGKKLCFEDALARLERIVAEMEGGELKLDDMLKRFDEGCKLVQFCLVELDSIRRRIEKVTSAEPPS